MKNTFTTMKENIVGLVDEDSNLTSSNSKYSIVNSCLQFYNKTISFTGTNQFKTDREDSVKVPGVTTPTAMVLQKTFEQRNRKLMFKKIHANSIKLDLRNVILLDSQSTMDIFCNLNLVVNIYKSKKKMCLQIKKGRIIITHKSQLAGYQPHVWFDCR